MPIELGLLSSGFVLLCRFVLFSALLGCFTYMFYLLRPFQLFCSFHFVILINLLPYQFPYLLFVIICYLECFVISCFIVQAQLTSWVVNTAVKYHNILKSHINQSVIKKSEPKRVGVTRSDSEQVRVCDSGQERLRVSRCLEWSFPKCFNTY